MEEMTKDDEAWYESQFDMFGTDGWKNLIEHIDKMREAYNDIKPLKTAEQLMFKQGQLDMLDWLASWQDMCEKSWEALTSDDEKDL